MKNDTVHSRGEVMRVSRELKWWAGWSCCAEPKSRWSYEVTVESPPGCEIGSVSQRVSCMVPAYQVFDQEQRAVLNIDPPHCCDLAYRCEDKLFTVNNLYGQEIGGIRKKWAGFVQESFTDADNLEVSFPIDLSARVNATLIGASFLIKKEWLEILAGWETKNKYVIMNEAGEQIYYAYESSDVCERMCCKAGRSFTIYIVDNTGREVMCVSRGFKCCAGWTCCAEPGSCAAHEVTVETLSGYEIGSVSQRPSCCVAAYQVQDQNKKPILNIDPPYCCDLVCSCDEKLFTINTLGGISSNFDEEEIGGICKRWAGCCQESFTDADNFEVSFPIDLSVSVKATLIGAAFLIDFVHFEQ